MGAFKRARQRLPWSGEEVAGGCLAEHERAPAGDEQQRKVPRPPTGACAQIGDRLGAFGRSLAADDWTLELSAAAAAATLLSEVLPQAVWAACLRLPCMQAS